MENFLKITYFGICTAGQKKHAAYVNFFQVFLSGLFFQQVCYSNLVTLGIQQDVSLEPKAT